MYPVYKTQAYRLLHESGHLEPLGEGIDSMEPTKPYKNDHGHLTCNILYYTGEGEDITGQGDYMPHGGNICHDVPPSIAPLFAASGDLAKTVINFQDHIYRLQEALHEADRRYSFLEGIYEDGIIMPEDMEELPKLDLNALDPVDESVLEQDPS